MGVIGNIARLIRPDLGKAGLLVASFVNSVWGYRNKKGVIQKSRLQENEKRIAGRNE